MTKIYKKLKTTIFIVGLMLTAGTAFAQYVSVQSGLASDPTTWGGTVNTDVPPLFGGTGTAANITISDGDTVRYISGFTLGTATSLTVETGGILVIEGDVQTNNNGASININGLMVTIGLHTKKGPVAVNDPGKLIVVGQLDIDANGPLSGDGEVYAVTLANGSQQPAATIQLLLAFKNWTGTTSDAWETATNWSPVGVPLSSERVLIDPLATTMPLLSSTTTIKSMVINSGQSLAIASNGALSVDSFLINEGTITLKSTAANATGNLFVGKSYSGAGIVNVERYLPSTQKWHVTASPVVQDNSQSFVTRNGGSLRNNGTNWAFGKYDTSSDSWSLYTLVPPSEELLAGQGYITSISATGTVDFSGSGINVGDISVPVSSAGFGWNALGNPYTTSILASGVNSFLAVNSASLDAGFEGLYIWDPEVPDYVVIAEGTYTFPAPGGETELTQTEISVGQGFIVKVAADGNLNFNSGMQTVAPATTFKSAQVQAPAMRLSIASGELINRTVIGYKPGMSDGWDKGYDLGKLKGNANIALYSKMVDGSSDLDLTVQSLEDVTFEKQIIPVGLDLGIAAEATFTLETVNFPEEAKVYLEDAELGIRTLLNEEGAEYKVELPALNGSDRFNLVVENFKSGQITTGIEPEVENLINVYSGHGKIIINGPVSREAQFAVYGIDGRMMVKTMAANLNRNEIDTSGFPSGIYLVRIEDTGKLQTKKVIVNNR